MMKLFAKGVIAALMIADTGTALSLLNENISVLQDPLAGPGLQAEFLYFAIKKADTEVIKFLSTLKSGGIDIPFYHFCGDTPIGLAQKEGLQEVLPNLLAKADKNFVLMTAVKLKNSSLIQFLLNSVPFQDRILHYLGIHK